MPPEKPEIVVQITQQFEDLEIQTGKIEELVKAVCKRFELTQATIGVAIVDDEHFCELNSRFRKSKSSSDCLSFDLSDNTEADSARLFELVVNGQLAVKQAQLRGHSSQAELALYITHGLLHNIGFDDDEEEQAAEMHAAEDQILEQLGYGSVYNSPIKKERTGDRPICE